MRICCYPRLYEVVEINRNIGVNDIIDIRGRALSIVSSKVEDLGERSS